MSCNRISQLMTKLKPVFFNSQFINWNTHNIEANFVKLSHKKVSKKSSSHKKVSKKSSHKKIRSRSAPGPKPCNRPPPECPPPKVIDCTPDPCDPKDKCTAQYLAEGFTIDKKGKIRDKSGKVVKSIKKRGKK